MALESNRKRKFHKHQTEESAKTKENLEENIVKDDSMEKKIVEQANKKRHPSQETKEESADKAEKTEHNEEHRQKRTVRQLNTVSESETEIMEQKIEQMRRKKRRRIRIIISVIVEVLTLGCIFGYGMILRYQNLTTEIQFNKKAVQNPNISPTKMKEMEGTWTVAVFGLDSRNGDLGKGNQSDVIMLVQVDFETGDIKLCSVYRDTYLNVNKNNSYNKINSAYAQGGPEQAVYALNKNLDLNITEYAAFNWTAVSDAIQALGGVDVEVSSKKEIDQINSYITETCLEAGISENPAQFYVHETGMQTLSGPAAVAYGRIRYIDNDFKRTERQREIIEKALQKAKQADIGTLNNLIQVVLKNVSTNIDTTDLMTMAKGIMKYNISESAGFPFTLETKVIGSKGDCVIPKDLDTNVIKLHEFLYGETDYKPSSSVYTYSNKIAADASGKGETTVKKKASSSTKKTTEATEKETVKKTTSEEDEKPVVSEKEEAKETDEKETTSHSKGPGETEKKEKPSTTANPTKENTETSKPVVPTVNESKTKAPTRPQTTEAPTPVPTTAPEANPTPIIPDGGSDTPVISDLPVLPAA